MAKCSSPAVPVSVLVLMKWISRLNFGSAESRFNNERVADCWLRPLRSSWCFSYLPLKDKQITLLPSLWLSTDFFSLCVCVICICTAVCLYVQLADAVKVTRLSLWQLERAVMLKRKMELHLFFLWLWLSHHSVILLKLNTHFQMPVKRRSLLVILWRTHTTT